MNEEQVTYFDSAEANAEKLAKKYSDTAYDDSTASTGAMGKLDEIKTKVAEITTNVGELTQGYKDLEGMYDEFTSFNETMDANIYRFETAISNIELRYNELKTAIEERIGDQVKADQELMQDMEDNTSQMENGETTPEDGTGTGTTPTGGETPAPSEETPSTIPTKSDAEIADEVIQGKWGTGDARKAALEAAGYDPNKIQDIVNKKMNGTYTGDEGTSGGGSTGGTSGDTPTPGTGEQESPLSPGETPAPEPTSPTFRGDGSGIPAVGSDGLIIRQQSQAGQDVINRLYSEIPSHANGTHSAQLDAMIDNLSPEECAWVLSRIENEGFGQKGAGYSTATPESHANFIQEQLIERYGGDIHNLLKHWGTYSYSGY